MPDDLARQFERLNRRLRRIEGLLGLSPLPDVPEERVEPPPTVTPPPTHNPPIEVAAKEEEQPIAAEPIDAQKPQSPVAAASVETPQAPPPIAPPTAPPTTPQPMPAATSAGLPRQAKAARQGVRNVLESIATSEAARPPVTAGRPPKSRAALEVLIGGKWMAWAGAIVVVVAVGFFVKLAMDEGWLGRLPPLLKCLLAGGFGAALVAAGEVALRRVGRTAAVGLFGAGLGTLYLTSFATFRFFHLLDESGAFGLLALTALIGFALTVRTRMLTIGVLSVLGGYFAPVLLSGASTFVAALPIYLSTLLAISLALSAWRAKPFRRMRYVAFGAHVLISLAWAADEGRSLVAVALPFLCLWWVMIVFEAVLAARRDESRIGNAVISLLSTLWFVTVGCWVLADASAAGADWAALFTAMTAVVAAGIAFVICNGVEPLRAPAKTALDQLAVALWAQFGVLLTVAVALQFDDYGQSIGWLVLALAAVEVGRRLGSRGVSIFGLLVGTLALLRVTLEDQASPALRGVLWEADWIRVTHWSLLALAAIIVTHTAARRISYGPAIPLVRLPIVISALSVLGWLGLCGLQCHGLAITGGWLIAVTLLLACERFGERQRYLETALLLLTLTAARWLLYDAATPRLAPDWNPTGSWPFLNLQMGLAAVIAVEGWWLARVVRLRAERDAATALPQQQRTRAVGWQLLLLGGILVLLIGGSFEIDRAMQRIAATVPWPVDHTRHLLWTILWSMGGLAVGLLVRTLRGRRGTGQTSLLTQFAWSLALGTAVKWVVFDCLGGMIGGGAAWRTSALAARPLLNLQMLAGVIVIGVLIVLYVTSRRERSAEAQESGEKEVGWAALGDWLPVVASVMLLWGLTFEVERAIGRWELAQPTDWKPLWPPMLLRSLWWTMLWAVGAFAMLIAGRVRGWAAMVVGGWTLLALSAAAWLTFDTVGGRTTYGVVLAPVVLNLQFAAGALLIVLLACALRFARDPAHFGSFVSEFSGAVPTLAYGLLGAIGLWLGTLELDRYFAPEAHRFASAGMARHTAFSIYWGVYSIGAVAAGFVWRSAWCRYAGLGLLTITLGKVLVVDMSEVRYVYRVLSLLGVGLLLVATSVAYGKLAPRLLGRTEGEPDADDAERWTPPPESADQSDSSSTT